MSWLWNERERVKDDSQMSGIDKWMDEVTNNQDGEECMCKFLEKAINSNLTFQFEDVYQRLK